VEPIVLGLFSILAMLILVLLGIPIAYVLGSLAIIGLSFLIGPERAIGHLASTAYGMTRQYLWAVVPLFVTIGALAAVADMTGPVFDTARLWVGRLRGGLAMATCVASGIFAACSGSTVANAAVFTPLALPEMLRYGYDKTLAAGCIAASGTFAVMIPPSITMVIYGIITGEPIGKLLIAGIIPGLISVVIYMVSIYIRVVRSPHLAPPIRQVRVTWGEKLRSLKETWAILAIFLTMIVGIYAGWFAPSAAGAVGAFATLVLVAFKKKLTWSNLKSTSLDVLVVNSSLFIIIIGGTLFSRFWVMSGVVTEVGDFMTGLPIPSIFVILMFLFAFLILGCIMDPASMMIIALPLFYPAVIKMGYDGVWFGILVVKMTEIAVITPPVGFNVFVVQAASEGKVELSDVFRGIFPFLLMDVTTLALLIAFPQITLWLPNTMK
jgi:C4-dicarboxylate transporter DctM subunit